MINEDQLEQLSLDWFRDKGWAYVYGPDIAPDSDNPERSDYRQVILQGRLLGALQAINPTIPTVPTAVSTPEANPPQTVERNLQDTSAGPSRAAPAGQEHPQIAHTHAELKFDETLNRIVGRVVDETTGETIHEVPPEQLKALYTKMREQLGPLVDGTA